MTNLYVWRGSWPGNGVARKRSGRCQNFQKVYSSGRLWAFWAKHCSAVQSLSLYVFSTITGYLVVELAIFSFLPRRLWCLCCKLFITQIEEGARTIPNANYHPWCLHSWFWILLRCFGVLWSISGISLLPTFSTRFSSHDPKAGASIQT